MVQLVQTPDGQIAEFPDSMSDAEIERVLTREFGAMAIPQRQRFEGEQFVPGQVPTLRSFKEEKGGLEAFGRSAFDRFVSNLVSIPEDVLRQGQPRAVGPPTLPSLELPRTDLAQETAQEFPFATGLGEVGGDVATLFTGRAPLRPALRMRGERLFKSRINQFPPGVRQQLQRVIESNALRVLGRGTLRTGEAGLEGAILAALDEGDPVNVAALSAGRQALGSMSLQLIKGLGTKAGIALAAATGLIGIQLARELTPGGRNRILESSEAAIQKLGALLALGAISGATGGGRVSGPFAKNLPLAADALTLIPRGAITSLIKDLTKEEELQVNRIEPVIDKFANDPKFFSKTERERLTNALNSEKSVLEEINSMMDDRDFRDKLDRLQFSRRPPELENAQNP